VPDLPQQYSYVNSLVPLLQDILKCNVPGVDAVPGTAWRWLGVFVSAAMFGLAHLYQGLTGVVTTAITGLILAIVYLRFGRIWPLIISQYLYDALQIGLVIYLIQKGLI
jgi:hypothetical protein